jgi:DUF1680 family protein
VDERGQEPHYYDHEARERGEDPADFSFKTYEYCQAHVPLRQQDKVVGHAVRAMYLLSAAADLSHGQEDASLWKACLRLWNNLVAKRICLTGGIGPAYHNEGFTEDYDLPDETAYAETCATIGMIQWNHRLLQISGESKFADEIERRLYNGFLGSVALEGGASSTRTRSRAPVATTAKGGLSAHAAPRTLRGLWPVLGSSSTQAARMACGCTF